MKKKVAILLAAVMTATMVPMSVFADSSNNMNKTVTVKDGDPIDGVFFKIQPGETIDDDSKVVLTFENAEIVDEADFEDSYEEDAEGNITAVHTGKYAYKLNDDNYSTLYKAASAYIESPEGFTKKNFDDVLGNTLSSKGDAQLPYKLRKMSKRQLEITLFPLPSGMAGESISGANKPYYYIPMALYADGTGDITAFLDANGTTVRDGVTYTIGTSSSSSGNTTTTVDEILVGSDTVDIAAVTVKESVQGTFVPNKNVNLKLNSGFEFYMTDKIAEENFAIRPGTNATFYTTNADGTELVKLSAIYFDTPYVTSLTKNAQGKYPTETIKTSNFDGNSFDFTMPIVSNDERREGKSANACSIIIEGLAADAEDDDDFGDIKITISGTSAGITRETIKVSERGDYGFSMKAIEDPTTIYTGRIGSTFSYSDLREADDYDSYITDTAYKQYDADDFLSATVEFKEITADSWNLGRKLEFTVPEGVKIFDFEVDEEEECRNVEQYGKITNNGRTLSFDLKNVREENSVVDKNEASKFELQLNLSVDPTVTGDIKLSVKGGGISEGDIEDVTIATAKAPITIEATETKSNMGYQKVPTSDIVITEAEDGILVKDGDVVISIDSIYGTSELGFADEGIDYEIDGDLKIKNFKVSEGQIKFKVDSSSSDEPSTITLKNVKIGTTRSVPYGTYGLKVGGSAVINNYSEDLVDIGDESTGNGAGNYEKGVGFFDDEDAFKFPNYLTVVTETGTLDSVVKVTIGEKTILVDDQAYDMDVAPYIQPSSNSTMVPLRFVMVALGVDSENVGSVDESNKVTYDATTKTATIFYAQGTSMTTIQFQAGSNVMKVNGAEIPMENGVKAEIVDGRMFVPFRAIGTAINVKVGWDSDTRTATYNADK